MIGLNKKRKMYLSPRMSSAEVDLEGSLLVTSQTLRVQWDETKNVNKEDGEGVGTPLYFE